MKASIGLATQAALRTVGVRWRGWLAQHPIEMRVALLGGGLEGLHPVDRGGDGSDVVSGERATHGHFRSALSFYVLDEERVLGVAGRDRWAVLAAGEECFDAGGDEAARGRGLRVAAGAVFVEESEERGRLSG